MEYTIFIDEMKQEMNTFMFENPPEHKTFLLRCWQERSPPESGKSEIWRFKLEDIEAGTHQGFADLETLIAALKDKFSHQNST